MRNTKDKTQHSISKLLEGEVESRTAKDLIKKWARRHKTELNKNWEHMRQKRPFTRIEPLT